MGGEFQHDIAMGNSEYERELQLQDIKDALYQLNHPQQAKPTSSPTPSPKLTPPSLISHFKKKIHSGGVPMSDRNGHDGLTPKVSAVISNNNKPTKEKASLTKV